MENSLPIIPVFDKESGPANNYRIPSIVTTKSGVVVACGDARYFTSRDNPNRIDKVVRRSFDSGKTWEDIILAVEEVGTSQKNSSAAVDPALLCDDETGRIFMIYCHTPAGIGILNSKCTVGESKDGCLYLTKHRKKYLLKDGKIFTFRNRPTKYTVSERGDITKDGKNCGNIYTDGEFKEMNTSYLMICHSDDDGKTWSKPVSLNNQVKESFMSFIGSGPGVGIQVKNGKYKGRLIFPIYFGTRYFPIQLSCAVMYSDDHGKTWKRGISPNDTRLIRRKVRGIKKVRNNEMLTESQLIELDDGRLKYYIRNHDPRRRVAVAYSSDGGHTWEDFAFDEQLRQPICQMSVIKIRGREKPYVIFVNPDSEKERKDGTVRLSEDDGATFPYSRVIKEGEFVYSSITELPDGDIGVLYEGKLDTESLDFIKFPIEWIKGE